VTIITPEDKGHPAGNSFQMNHSNEVKVDMETNKMEDDEFSSKPNDHHMENENETNAKVETTHEQVMKTTEDVDLDEEKIDKENKIILLLCFILQSTLCRCIRKGEYTLLHCRFVNKFQDCR
jgi:hypothetical protein